MGHREGFHYGPCSTASGGVLRLALLAAAIGAVVFWPTVVAVATTVALVVKIILITVAIVAVLGTAAVTTIAVRRRRSAPSASMTAIESERDRCIEEQLATLTAAVERLERDRQPALSAPTHLVTLDPQALTLLAQLAAITDSPRQRLRVLPKGWDER
jgi:membrane protein implicated in regulation of membrane protease activity